MRRRTIGAMALATLIFTNGCSHVSTTGNSFSAAWNEWKRGNISESIRLASLQKGGDEASHILTLSYFVSGNYRRALEFYSSIGKSYPRYKELDSVVIDAYLHLDEFEKAYLFAKKQDVDPWVVRKIQHRNNHRLKIQLDKTTYIPFVKHRFDPFIPGFDVEINGIKTLALFDTGASFVVMGIKSAQRLGVKTDCGGKGDVGDSYSTELCFGSVVLKLGEATLENIPVTVIKNTERSDYDNLEPMVGTNLLQRFYSTLDYPKRRLILSPKGNAKEKRNQVSLLKGKQIRVPFYLWGDHYMIARGKIGEDSSVNFFVDSGLVLLYGETKDSIRQAGFHFSKSELGNRNWSVDKLSSGRMNEVRVFRIPEKIGFYDVEQEDHLGFYSEKVAWSSLGGITVHGLLSHAYLNKYMWTLDFEEMTYTFTK